MKRLLSGNEAIAHGAYLAGVRVACGYPGTPSTEILENLTAHKEVQCEWSPNEKVALEVGIGASLGGARSLVTMKHVGLNVAADPLFTLAYTGVNAGLVVISADDPGLHSSQNEQDNRHYARAAKVPMLEPSDSQEAMDMIADAFKLSEDFDTPVIFRTTTRVAHSKGVVEVDGQRTDVRFPAYQKNPAKTVMIPAHARLRHTELEERLRKLQEFSETYPGNRIDKGGRIGVISSGVAYQYAREVFPNASFLKLGMSHPLPVDLVKSFVKQVDQIYVIEELDPFLEDQVRQLAPDKLIYGKNRLPSCGEFSPELVRGSFEPNFEHKKDTSTALSGNLPPRPPVLCPGCPHRGVFYVLRQLKPVVMGDIGCYTLGVLPPLESMDTCTCMGAGIGEAFGFQKATGRKDVVAVIGDSTFVHSGITPLIDTIYNRGSTTVIILDNRTTGMTGRQDHPGTGRTLAGEETHTLDFEALAKAVGVQSVAVFDPYDLKAVRGAIRSAVASESPSVLISRRPCLLVSKPDPGVCFINETCDGCGACLRLGCPALGLTDGRAEIDETLCTGCDLCSQVCKFGAVGKEAGN